MAKLIFSYANLPFANSSAIGKGVSEGSIDTFALTEGTTYSVIWDGVKYECTAQAATINDTAFICIGNLSLYGDGEDTGEPFLVLDTGTGTKAFVADDTAVSHTIVIYEGAVDSGWYLMQNGTLTFEASGDVYQSSVSVGHLTVGKTYTVIWDGLYYECVAQSVEVPFGDTTITEVYLGNASILLDAYEDTGEPFVYAVFEDTRVGGFTTLSTAETHVVSIYEGVLKEERWLLYNETLTGFAEYSTGTYVLELSGTLVSENNSYLVDWDGTAYVCHAPWAGGGGVIGNWSILGSGTVSTGEPFYIVSEDGETLIATSDTAESHTVSVYQFPKQSGWLMRDEAVSCTYDAENGLAGFGAVSTDGGVTWRDGNGNEKEELLPIPIPDKTYTVTFDGTTYVLTAKLSAYEGGVLYVSLGNDVLFESSSPDTGEPFDLVFNINVDEGMVIVYFLVNDTADTTHTVSIYAGKLGQLFSNVEAQNVGGTQWVGYLTEAVSLAQGQEYTLTINGTEYVCTARMDSGSGTSVTYLGNGSLLNGYGADTGETFGFAMTESFDESGAIAPVFVLVDGSETALESCVVSLYTDGTSADDDTDDDSGTEDTDTPTTADIITLDSSGNAVTHTGIRTVSFDTTDGHIATFTLTAISSD